MCFGVITLVALLRARIPNKDTFERLIIKFVSERTQVMNKANTTKNTKKNRKDRGESGFNT